ncbi:MAG: hypothetical protein ACLFRV_05435 [Acidimicrobiales bacterium]
MSSSRRTPLDSLLDVVVYAPIGAFFHGPKVVSELAERGRGDLDNARAVGTMAIARGRQEAEQLRSVAAERMEEVLVAVARAAGAPLAGTDAPDESETASTSPPSPANAPRSPETTPSPGLRVVDGDAPGTDELPIPDYDNLSASQVVPRLDDLAEEELDRVQAYEQAHRSRMTILSRIAQLQAS